MSVSSWRVTESCVHPCNPVLCFPLLSVRREVPRQHPAPPVPGNVPSECGQRGHLHARDEKHVQPSADSAQKVRPEGKS